MAGFIELQTDKADRFNAWSVTPAQPNGRGLVILPEVYNVNPWLRTVAQRYADRGFTVLVPDLFWRQAPGVHLDYDEPERAREQGANADIDGIVSDVGVAARWLRGAAGGALGEHAKVSALGFCIGGRLALLASAREPINSVISYYGVQLDRHLEELQKIQIPALLHFGDLDPWVPAETVKAVEHHTSSKANFALHHYHAGHGFARNGYPPFDEKADAQAWRRNLAFLS